MNLTGDSVRDRLRRLNDGIRVPPHSVWLPFFAATEGGNVIAEIGERADLPDGGSSVAYTALLPKRIVRVVATGTGRWEDPLSGAPDDVTVRSIPIEGALLELEGTSTERSELGSDFTIRTTARLTVDGSPISVPCFPASLRDDAGLVDAFTGAVIAEVNRDASARLA
ncbi:hypothetical protein [Aeromicrobium sp. Sec7.5]|uniref:hypothetical protein n=1 Tax=Aeromicrobium sp. Sec7.5 TaxID=3121276 RepID=UPI002FE454C7